MEKNLIGESINHVEEKLTAENDYKAEIHIYLIMTYKSQFFLLFI